MWLTFLKSPLAYCRPFMEFGFIDATDINMFSDASKSLTHGGLGAICEDEWMSAPWNYELIQAVDPSIEYLELFALTAAV